MTPYYEGTSEAEQLVRGAPELVDAWLRKAKLDRNRLAIRWFQPQRREFLDGFITGLEHFVARRNAPGESDAPLNVPPGEESIDPGSLDEAGYAGTPAARPPLESSSVTAELEEAPCGDPVDASPELERLDPHTPPVAAASEAASEEHTSPAETLSDRPEPGGESEIKAAIAAADALGVVELSGWTIDVDPQADALGVGETPTVAAVVAAEDQPIEPASVSWTQMFEQARGGGMVDLSAYDFLDGLGELRDLIDHWHHLRQDAGSGNDA